MPERRCVCRIKPGSSGAHCFDSILGSKYRDGLALPHLPPATNNFPFFRASYFSILRLKPAPAVKLPAETPAEVLVAKANWFVAFSDSNYNDWGDFFGDLISIDHILLPTELKAKAEFPDMSHQHDHVEHSDYFFVAAMLRLEGMGVAAVRRGRA